MRKIESAPNWRDHFDEAVNLLIDKDHQSLVNKINERYLFWDKVKYQTTEMDPKKLWASVKFSRLIHSKKVQFGNYLFKYNLTDYILKGLHEFDLHIGGHLGSDNIIPSEDKKKYLISSIMEEAIASSQIEGAVTTRKQAKEMLRKSVKPRNKSEQMIVNNFVTIKHIVNIKNEQITKEKLFEIHKLITHQTMGDSDDEGKYRDHNEINVVDVIDGEIVHTPPSHDEIDSLMDGLFDFFNDKDSEKFIHPIIKGCIIHFMIGFIHPFVDGNGRTARALFYWYLLRKGYWLTEYLSISRLIVKSKTQYAQAFIHSEVDENDLTYFITYKLKTMQLAFQGLREYIQRKINEKKQLIHFQRIKGINENQALIIKWIYEEPDLLLNVKEIENRFNVSNQTARTYMNELVKKGYLDVIFQNKKTRSFCKGENFDEILKKELPNSASSKLLDF